MGRKFFLSTDFSFLYKDRDFPFYFRESSSFYFKRKLYFCNHKTI